MILSATCFAEERELVVHKTKTENRNQKEPGRCSQ